MYGEVKVWYMSEEERLAYINRYPIRSTEKTRKIDYKWRPEKARAARMKKK